MINNLPIYANEYKYIVASEIEIADFWFYGAYNDCNEANRVAEAIGGVVFENN